MLFLLFAISWSVKQTLRIPSSNIRTNRYSQRNETFLFNNCQSLYFQEFCAYVICILWNRAANGMDSEQIALKSYLYLLLIDE
jgi:hypothetical protein